MGCQAVGSVAPNGPRDTLFGIISIDIIDLYIQNANGQLSIKELFTTLKMSNQKFRSKSYHQATIKDMNEKMQFIVNSRYQTYGRSLIVDVLDRGIISDTSIGVGMLDLQYIITDKKASETKVYLNNENKNVGWISIRAQFQQIQAFPITLLFENVVIRRKTGSKRCKIRTTVGEEVLQTSVREDRQDQPPQWKDEHFTFYVLKDAIQQGKVEVLDGDAQIGSISINLKQVQASLQQQIQIKEQFHYQQEIVAGTIKFIISKGITSARKDTQIKQSSFISPSKRKLPPLQKQKDTHLIAKQKISNQKENNISQAKQQKSSLKEQSNKDERIIQVKPDKLEKQKQVVEVEKKQQLQIIAKQQQAKAMNKKKEQQQIIAREIQAKQLKDQQQQLTRLQQIKKLKQQSQKALKQEQLRKAKEKQEIKTKQRQQQAKRIKEENQKKASQQYQRKQRQELRLAAEAKETQQRQLQEQKLQKQKEDLLKAKQAKRIKQQQEAVLRQQEAQRLKQYQQKIFKEEQEREKEQKDKAQQQARKQREKQALQEAEKAQQSKLRQQYQENKLIEEKMTVQNLKRRQIEEKQEKHEKNIKRKQSNNVQQHKLDKISEESKPKEQLQNSTKQIFTIQPLPKRQQQGHHEHNIVG